MITTLLFTERKGPKGGGRQNCSHLPLKQEDITHSFYDPISADNGNREVYYVMVIMIPLSVRKNSVRTFTTWIKNKINERLSRLCVWMFSEIMPSLVTRE